MIQLLSITSVLLLLIFSATSVCSQGLPVANCWLDAPELVESSIHINVIPENITTPDGRTSWNLFATVTWQRPPGMEPEDMFILKLTSFDGTMGGESVLTDPCLVTNEEIIEAKEEHVFNNLSFGQLYELEIYLFRPVQQRKSIMGAITAFQTPECFQVTGDMDFCMHQVVVQYSGAPIEPQVNSLCRNSSTSLLRVSLSWLPPFQVNGNIFLYAIDYGVVVTPAPDVVMEPPTLSFQTLNIFPPILLNGTNQTDIRILTTLQGLEEGKLYYVRVTPIVDSAVDGGKYPGEDIELTFVTANWTDPMGETTEINLATPLCELLDEPTIVPTENETFTDNSTIESMTTSIPSSSTTIDKSPTTMSTATTPARLPPSTMEPAHIALIVIFSILIIIVVVVFIVITIRMAKTGHVTKLPQLSQIPAMCKKQSQSDGSEKRKKDLSTVEKGVKTTPNSSKQKQTAKPQK